MCLNTCVIEILTSAFSKNLTCQKWLVHVLPENRHLSNWSFFSVAEDMKYAVCTSCKQKVSRGGATTNDYCFISCYFISFKIKSNNLNVKYWIGYRYRQISVIKNRNIGILVFSHIGASLMYM